MNKSKKKMKYNKKSQMKNGNNGCNGCNGNCGNDEGDEETNSDDDEKSGSSIYDFNGISTEITNYSMETPLVDSLINMRKKYKTNGSSNHIAAIIPDKHYFTQSYNSLIVVKGINSDKTKYGNKNVQTHAEMDALKKTNNLIKCNKIKKGKRMSLIILRVNRNNKLCCSAPCLHCTMQLSKSKSIVIDKIYFSTDSENIVCIKFNDWKLNPSSHITNGWRLLNKKNIERKSKLKN